MIEKIKELNSKLKEAAKAYYVDGKEIMSNFEYDKLYDELLELEKQSGIILSDSVTQNVGYDVMSELKKEKHSEKMLSLDKTKDKDQLKEWLGDKKGVLSFKEDGLTVVLNYNNGKLVKAVTRGNGEIGEIITHTAKFMNGVPVKIPYKDKLVVRGEALITYSEFKRINNELDVDSQYKNPRNLVSGTIRQLDASIMKNRKVDFCAFTLVSAENKNINSFAEQLKWLKDLGFQVVEHELVDKGSLFDKMNEFTSKSKTSDFPADGLVLFYDDIKYGKSLGNTSKFPRNGIAFKWADEIQKTTLREIEWSASRTGLLNPVAIFDSVELEGTTVSRASIHNVSIIEDMKLNIGDEISVYKANMIIPQIAENNTKSLKDIHDVVPTACPVCSGIAAIESTNGTKVLKCINNNCPAKHVGQFEHFVSRDAMNIVGLSTATIEKLISIGALNNLKDIFYLSRHKDKIVELEGLGLKTYNNLIENINNAKVVEPARFLYALGIENVGRSVSRDIMKYADYDFDKLMNSKVDLYNIDGVGSVIAQNITNYFDNNYDEIKELMKEVIFDIPKVNNSNSLDGKTFVITGKVNHFNNRDELKEMIEKNGGKVTGSVTSKTNYLINNDTTSTSGKNKKAKELNIPIISEDEFLKMI